MMVTGPKLSFDDVYIIPKASELKSRSEVNLDIAYVTKHSKKRLYGRPVMITNMDGVGTIEMAEAVYPQRIFTLLTKFEDRKRIANFLRNKEAEYTFVSIGESNEDILSLQYIFKESLHTPKILIDCANAYRYSFLDSIKRIRDLMPNSIVMAGNVCTPDGVENLIKAGADICRVGISNGAHCLSFNKTGVGYKQFSVALECSQVANELQALICSDGGCKQPGDICKALGAGAHLVCAGTLFAGTDECVGDWCVDSNGEKKFMFYGMSSKIANDKHFGGLKEYRTSEGKESWINSKGSVTNVVQDILGGLASVCTYTNTKNIENLSKNCDFTY